MTTQAEAITRAGARFAAARAERDQIAQREGPEGVARWVCKDGSDRDRADIANFYRLLHDETHDGPTAA